MGNCGTSSDEMRNKPHKVTLAEVSRRAGVSTITASRVLNGSAGPVGVREETRLKVLRAARTLGYRPNALARAMRTGRTGNVGLVVIRRDDGQILTGDQFYNQVIEGVEHELLENGYNILIAVLTPEERRDLRLPRIAAAGFVDGLLFLGVHDRAYLQHVSRAYRRVVAIDEPTFPGVACVFTANSEGGCLAARHLCELGHRRLAAITTDVEDPSFQQRIEGFVEEAGRQGASVIAVERGDAWSDGGYTAMNALLRRGGFTAVFCGNDHLAIYALRACQEHGVVVPRDMSVIGFDDVPVGEHTNPPLTTIQVQKRELGKRAAQLLRQLIDGKPSARPQVVVPVALRIRSSTGPPPPV
jgi:DNA-binding LacI/PurR family transcriptional regulator